MDIELKGFYNSYIQSEKRNRTVDKQRLPSKELSKLILRERLMDNLCMVRLSRLIHNELPMHKNYYNIHDERDLFREILDYKTEYKPGWDIGSWKIGGVYHLDMEQFCSTWETEDILHYVSSDIREALLPVRDFITMEYIFLSASNATSDYDFESEKCQEDIAKAISSIAILDEESENYDEQFENALEGVLTGLEYAFYSHFVADKGYPDNVFGELAKAAIRHFTNECFFSYQDIIKDKAILERIVFNFFAGSFGGYCAGDDYTNSYFFTHPIGNLIYKEHEDDLKELREMITDIGSLGNNVAVYEYGDILVLRISFNSCETVAPLAVLIKMFMDKILEYEQQVINKQMDAGGKIPA